MSRFFEALQQAEKERLQRDKPAEEQKWFLQGNVDHTRTVDMVDSHHCKEYAVRIRREGLIDFLFRLGGIYPWQCSRCKRVSYRFLRSPFH